MITPTFNSNNSAPEDNKGIDSKAGTPTSNLAEQPVTLPIQHRSNSDLKAFKSRTSQFLGVDESPQEGGESAEVMEVRSTHTSTADMYLSYYQFFGEPPVECTPTMHPGRWNYNNSPQGRGHRLRQIVPGTWI